MKNIFTKHNGHGLIAFWTKINNDWIFNLAGWLAYSFLMSIFPFTLVLLAITGFILNAIPTGDLSAFENELILALPSGGADIVLAATTNLKHGAGPLLILGIASAIVIGSGLFATMEGCFGIIFRLQGRDPVAKNVMAISMLLLYLLLVPLLLLTSFVPEGVVTALGPTGKSGVVVALAAIAGFLIALFAAFVLFGLVYLIVPNWRANWRNSWPGTLVAAALLILYERLFPYYASTFLRPSNWGSVAGFAIVVLIFFYYLGFILLLGAEVNSWVAGQRQTAGDLPTILHQVQAHRTVRGAAGPTAGQPQEDLQHSEEMESSS